MEVIHHDLEPNGTINYYKLKIEENVFIVPAKMVESVLEQQHEHEIQK